MEAYKIDAVGRRTAEFHIDSDQLLDCFLDQVEGRRYRRTVGHVRSDGTGGLWRPVTMANSSPGLLMLDLEKTSAVKDLTGNPSCIVGELVSLEDEESGL